MSTMVLLDLMGGVALLLWGLHMVRSGILRAFGSDLRYVLSKAVGNRFSGFAAGVVLTAILQSSTATGLMTASFAASGMVALVPALAIMLGANVGTALIVQVLAFNVSAAAPVFLLAGLIAFRSGRSRAKDLGRVAIGLGLMLLALHILIDTLAPAEQAPNFRALLAIVTADPLFCVVFAAALTWAAHSSVATILLVMSLAYSQFITPVSALTLVIGANLGSAINPVVEAAHRGDVTSYRLPVGNLLNRLIGAALVLSFLGPIADHARALQPDMARMTAEFHIAFNIALALAFIALLDPLAWLLTKVFPAPAQAVDPAAPRYLDETALETPSLALADAARETLRMGDIVETMLRDVMTALTANDRVLAAEVSRKDNQVDRLDEAIKLYVTRLTRGSLDEREGRRATEIIAFSINLEHIGDIIDKNLTELAAKKIKRKLQFSDEGAAELTAFHKRILESLRLALGAFMSGDAHDAKRLIAEKAELRSVELAAADSHLARLREGRPESIESSSLHLDVLRDLKRIHSHICSVAYPILEGAGMLKPGRHPSWNAEHERDATADTADGAQPSRP
jgi:phosphate:Na+ symporter